MAHEAIKTLARLAAARGLKMRQANALFDALYVADALSVSNGSVSKAARLANVNRECLHRMEHRARVRDND